jgi:hypothetical protein
MNDISNEINNTKEQNKKKKPVKKLSNDGLLDKPINGLLMEDEIEEQQRLM